MNLSSLFSSGALQPNSSSIVSNLASAIAAGGVPPKPKAAKTPTGPMTTGSASDLGNYRLPSTPDDQALLAPNIVRSAGILDQAAMTLGANMTRGRTSTILTGGQGENESLLNTSKILLGR